MILDLLSLPDPPTAIFAANDELALEVLEVARDLNLEIPRDLSVIGYDNTEMARFARLTTGGRHLFELGAQGAKRLFEAIDQPDRPPTQVQLSTELVLRHTTAPPGN
jgi:DNA-binding LacI/PurR family transcriptional regulator